MSQPTNRKFKQWMWFVALWCGGLLSVFALSMIIKMIMNIG
jgi:hypothetical protein